MASDSAVSNKNKRRHKRPKKITPTYLHNYALFYLERFASTSAHLKTVLMRRVHKSIAFHKEPDMAEAEGWVDELVIRFVETGLVDDKVYAKGRTQSLRRSGNSRRQIMAKLMQKGLKTNVIDQALETVDVETGEDAELQAACRYVQRRRLGRDAERHQKDLASLARAGFAYDIAQKALQK